MRSGYNLGPPAPAGDIPSISMIAINSCSARIYNVGFAIDILVAYLLSKLQRRQGGIMQAFWLMICMFSNPGCELIAVSVEEGPTIDGCLGKGDQFRG